MKISHNILNCLTQIPAAVYLKEKYPDGTEPMEIMNDGVPPSVLFFLRKYFISTEEEKERYAQLCEIESSSNVWESIKVFDSNNVVGSQDVHDSAFIYDSRGIAESENIYGGANVELSSNVLFSKEVSESNKILNSQSIQASQSVNYSNNIDWSSFILYSDNVTDSMFIYKGEQVYNSAFCGFMKNANHCLFCNGLSNVDYYIFNKEVTETMYTEWYETLLYRVGFENPTFITLNYNRSGIDRFNLSNRLDDIFLGLSKEFYGWVGTMPNYSDDVFLSLFFKEK